MSTAVADVSPASELPSADATAVLIDVLVGIIVGCAFFWCVFQPAIVYLRRWLARRDEGRLY
eukprot:4535514-Prymnesium_polylepis.1